ncbi:hypothetical protein I8752_14540 [Nostocaceae cyanobacterium CENA369]|uniref:Uncharacterized protein n=1 Tax=Dendronalium phyllosphericum CENA369 TaxID=1725256 RepID=A0A8J7LFK9_9NOST|nr:hormogonium polysaccharide biosynthesis protein HpsA [Dendronalium phyllosphericum]MBH8574213.1 hypothetical protein [Dendronalium phyllosphericum CENA369]
MFTKRQIVKTVKKISKQISKNFLSAIKKQIIWLLRTLFVPKRRRSSVNAGFVLPTVVMVSLVVLLLTTAILFRSFERSKNASNVRVNETVLNATTPAIDRARAKLNKLFQDGRLPRATPTDDALYSTLTNNINEYTFGDETPLKLTQGTNNITTAWLYPVDTNNNGKFDSYTLYGIYFKNPPITSGVYTRARNTLEARTPPMTAGSVNGDCGDNLGTSATLVGSTGWFNIGGKLKKSFFAYTATVPITTPPNSNYEQYKGNKGFVALEYEQDRVQLPLVNNAVVYEDDIALAPGTSFKLNGRIFTNSNFITAGVGTATVKLYQVSSVNSCFYEDDNAKIIIGGNLGAGGFTDASDLSSSTVVHLYRGKGVDPTTVSGGGATPGITANKSVTAGPSNIAYNSLAYVQRINRLVSAQMANSATGDPQEVKDAIQKQKTKLGLSSYTTDEEERFRRQQLEAYFKRRTRRVPYAEVGFGGNALGDYAVGGSKESELLQNKDTAASSPDPDKLRPPDPWIYPTDTTDNTTGTNYTKLTLNTSSSTKLLPAATEPNTLQKDLEGKEQTLGDRALIGNNLPELWWNKTSFSFVGPNPQDTQSLLNFVWDNGTGTRTRRSRVEQLADLGATERDKDWELAAAKVPTSPQDPVGGLRVVTGAGVYLPSRYTTTGRVADVVNGITITADTDFSTAASVTTNIWSDMMPVASQTAATSNGVKDADIVLVNGSPKSGISVLVRGIKTDQQLLDEYTPYLRMRATAVYHYNIASYNEKAPSPIACVSSYYDPTSNARARNKTGLPDVSPINSPQDNTNNGNSNNGVVYAAPDTANGETTYANVLSYQAKLQYPNGRWVNEPLKNALAKTTTAARTLSERSAVESALCAIQILDGTVSVQTTPIIPHGAITETAFLDARQIKAIHKDNGTTPALETFTNADSGASVPSAADYNLPKEQRQPLEIRATILDINQLRQKSISGGVSTVTEYLLPNSGIIYATRDDALLDLSSTKPTGVSSTQQQETQKTESPVDFILDPTRRPNAIMLINGDKIWRGSTTNDQRYRDAEKGLILASNLPVYVKGNLNLHTQQEFTDGLQDDWSNFYTRPASGQKRNVQFACRPGDARLQNCTTGDEWRPATVLADAVTLLSNSFQLGFRNDGDYDLNNNLGDSNSNNAFKANGFFTNNYVTNANWYNSSTGFPKIFSSYLNNFVTPIQRRVTFNEYLMELCPKLPVSACGSGDWYVDLDPTNPTNYTAHKHTWDISGGIVGQAPGDLESATTATPAATAYQRYPRRVAFKRDTTIGKLGNLVLDSNNLPIPLGIDSSSGNVAEFPYSSTTYPKQTSNALWFQTTTKTDAKSDNSNDDPVDTHLLLVNETLSSTQASQPRLQAVLQINKPSGIPSAESTTYIGPPSNSTGSNVHNNWLQLATDTTFNLVSAAGDTPARSTEDNGGLHNFVRFLENWNPTDTTADAIKARISGSFIQFKRSAYATGPFRSLLTDSYPIVGNGNKAPFYIAPTRQWGYDVGLLSQSPDLFAQKLVRVPDDLPDEYFREVGRDDPWVKTLLCAKRTDDTYAIDADQRPCS